MVEPVCRAKARRRPDTASLRFRSGHTKLNFRLLLLLVFATSTCHVLLCSDIIRLPIKFGIPRWLLLLACTMGDSKVEDFLLKEHPEEATADCGAWPDSVLSQMLQEATQLPVMESEQNRIVSLCPNLAQPTPVFQQNGNTKSQYPK